MNASPHPPARPAPLHRQLILRGLLPMTLVALALAGSLGVLHMRALSGEARTVARIQAIRLGASMDAATNDEAVRYALTRALSRSAPTESLTLRRDDAPDLVIDSGRHVPSGRALRVRLNTPLGELETVSDATSLHERRAAAAFMTLLLCCGVLAVFLFTRRALERDVIEPIEGMRDRIDAFLHPRQAKPMAGGVGELAAIDALLDELVDLRRRHDMAMSDALRQRLQDIARHTRFIEQVGDHFRQPLQALALFVAGMQPGEDLRQRAVLGQMRTSLTRLNELLDGLLAMARFDAGAVEPHAIDLIASDLFVRERAAIDEDASRLGVDVHWRGGRLPLHGDPALLGELLHRLVANAVISTPNGRVLVAARRRGDAVRLEVRDNGMGLEPIQQERVFEEFTRLPGHAGYGIALAVARRIVDTLGGSIGVRSRPGRGTLFWVQLEGASVGVPSRTAPTLSRHPAL
ncbi:MULTISPECIES: HAMP domain-containing sensor histidine kinase [Luteibacter]|uniref:sensor histidine kinase n=1 Tax=Luteibacter sp. dw_328 TaxID=2719796 RepID=UPI0007BEEF54|nr:MULTISPECIES: HAMP domain-containing sensor histidine kinase [Luteibacter]